MRLRRLCLEIFDFRRFFSEPITIWSPIQASHLRKRNLLLAFCISAVAAGSTYYFGVTSRSLFTMFGILSATMLQELFFEQENQQAYDAKDAAH